MMLLSTFLYLTPPTLAEMPFRPLRPTTHPGDPALSDGALVNFQRLYIDPETIANQLVPLKKRRASERESLAIINRTTAWVDVTVSGTKIGRIGPLTTGVIHDLLPGEYAVDHMVENTQFSYRKVLETTVLEGIITPGNKEAAIAASSDYIKPGFDTIPAPTGGNLITYNFPIGAYVASERIETDGEGGSDNGEIEAVPTKSGDNAPSAVPVE